jgi:hypothetical protein
MACVRPPGFGLLGFDLGHTDVHVAILSPRPCAVEPLGAQGPASQAFYH